MKKIMILLLSLAVLFSFAACDNSSDTPSDDTVSGGVTEAVVRMAAGQIDDLLETTADVVTVLDASNAKIANLSTDHLSYTISKEDVTEAIPGTGVVATDVSLTVKGEMKANNVTNGNGSQEITLGSYTYTFTAPITDAAGNYTTLSGSISGALVGGSMKVTMVDNTVTGVTITDPTTVLLPASGSDMNVTIGDEKVDSALLFSFIDNASKGNLTAKNRAAYDDEQNKAAEAKVSAFVTELLNGATNNLGTALAGVFKASGTDITGVTATSTYTPATGVAVYNLTVASDADLTDASVDAIAIGADVEAKVAAGTTFTVTLTPAALGQGESADKWANGSTATTYSINGKLVLTTPGSTEFTSIQLNGVIGNFATAGIAVTKADDPDKGATLPDSVSFAADSGVVLTAGTAIAPMQVGPALDGKGEIAFTDVDVTFVPAEN